MPKKVKLLSRSQAMKARASWRAGSVCLSTSSATRSAALWSIIASIAFQSPTAA
jgi:hypothetical protein